MKQLLCCSDSDSDTGSFNGFLQLPIRPNSIFPLSVVYGIMGWGLFVHVCMYSCIHVCMHKCMYISVYICIIYVLRMHNTHICVYVCMYTNTNQIYNARNVTSKCESEARNHTYMMQVHVCTQCILKIKLHLYIFFNGLVRGSIGSPLDSPLVKMHRGNCNLTMADSKL